MHCWPRVAGLLRPMLPMLSHSSGPGPAPPALCCAFMDSALFGCIVVCRFSLPKFFWEFNCLFVGQLLHCFESLVFRSCLIFSSGYPNGLSNALRALWQMARSVFVAVSIEVLRAWWANNARAAQKNLCEKILNKISSKMLRDCQQRSVRLLWCGIAGIL